VVRLFVPLPEVPPADVVLSGERRHYLVHVLRLAEGSSLEVFDGTGISSTPWSANAALPSRVVRNNGPRLQEA
jgi:16S rRNA U1498 N3-methylase RsmE